MAEHHAATTKAAPGQKTLKSYFIGLGLSLLFTLVAFWLVSEKPISINQIYIALTGLAIAQLLAQVIFFLRMNMSPEGRWTSITFIFVIVVVLILVGGSLWIMYNLNYNMVN